MREVYVSDFIEPVINNLTKMGETKIYLFDFINRMEQCKFFYPRLFENANRKNFVQELDKLNYLGVIKYSKDNNGLYFNYVEPTSRTFHGEENLSEATIVSLAKKINNMKNHEASL